MDHLVIFNDIIIYFWKIIIMQKTAIIYCRTSTKTQADYGFSLENQEEACSSFCNAQSWKISQIFKEAYTWKKKHRPELEKAVNFAKNTNVNYFVIFDIDRFTREWFSTYSELKTELESYWIELRDSKYIIQAKRVVYTNDVVDMTNYNWNIDNPSESSEAVMSTVALQEWKKILQRTIPRMVQLEQMWYQVRWADYWYINQKIKTDFWKAVIQVAHPIEADFIIEMYKAKARWMEDQKIVDILNLKWFKSRNWNSLTIKQMNKYIEKPIYAGIVKGKWTGNEPINAPYKWLVSIDLWNNANKWRFTIYKHKNQIVLEKWNKRKYIKKDDKEDYIFRWIVKYQNACMRAYKSKDIVYYREWSKISPPFNISQKILIELFEKELENINLTDFLKSKIEHGILEFFKEETKDNDKNEKYLEKEVEKLKLENKEIIKKSARWKITDEIMQEIIEENDIKIKEFKKDLIKINERKQLISTEVAELLNFLLNTKEEWKKSNLSSKAYLIKILIDELNFTNKKTLEIKLSKVFDLLKSIKNSVGTATGNRTPVTRMKTWCPNH